MFFILSFVVCSPQPKALSFFTERPQALFSYDKNQTVVGGVVVIAVVVAVVDIIPVVVVVVIAIAVVVIAVVVVIVIDDIAAVVGVIAAIVVDVIAVVVMVVVDIVVDIIAIVVSLSSMSLSGPVAQTQLEANRSSSVLQKKRDAEETNSLKKCQVTTRNILGLNALMKNHYCSTFKVHYLGLHIKGSTKIWEHCSFQSRPKCQHRSTELT